MSVRSLDNSYIICLNCGRLNEKHVVYRADKTLNNTACISLRELHKTLVLISSALQFGRYQSTANIALSVTSEHSDIAEETDEEFPNSEYLREQHCMWDDIIAYIWLQ